MADFVRSERQCAAGIRRKAGCLPALHNRNWLLHVRRYWTRLFSKDLILMTNVMSYPEHRAFWVPIGKDRKW